MRPRTPSRSSRTHSTQIRLGGSRSLVGCSTDGTDRTDGAKRWAGGPLIDGGRQAHGAKGVVSGPETHGPLEDSMLHLVSLKTTPVHVLTSFRRTTSDGIATSFAFLARSRFVEAFSWQHYSNASIKAMVFGSFSLWVESRLCPIPQCRVVGCLWIPIYSQDILGVPCAIYSQSTVQLA